MGKHRLAFVAFDSAKNKHAVAIADSGRGAEVRYLGEISIRLTRSGSLWQS
jgi:transposase